jgi:hypothetical protein
MGYHINWAYCWYNNHQMIVKMYFIENIPFTFDDISKELQNDPEVLQCAENQLCWSAEELFQKSSYLIEEELHPLLFDIEIDNPEVLPNDDFMDDEEEYV